jgi:DNA-binding NarL/FixJ family response regulator
VTIRVVLADDHPVVRQGLAAMLGSVEGIEVVGEAADGRAAVEAALASVPDVIVLDVHMPELDGVAAAAEIRRSAPDVAILMLTMLDDDESVRAAVAAGAAGYVLKGDSQEKIVRAIQAVSGGDAFLTSGVARHLLDPAAPAGRTGDPLFHLTPRERRVLDLLATGLSTVTIAARLGVASKTVSNNLSTIFAKLGVTNRTEAALLARRHGLGARPGDPFGAGPGRR